MNKQYASFVVLLALVAGVFWLWPSEGQLEQDQTFKVSQQPETKIVSINDRDSVALTFSAEQAPTAEAKENPEEVFLQEAIQGQISDIAEQYASNMRFPSYSKPLSSADWNLLNPRPFVPRPIPLDSGSGLAGAIMLPNAVVLRGDELALEVHITGNEAEASRLKILAWLDKYEAKTRTPLRYQKRSNGKAIYSGSFDADLIDEIDGDQGIILAELDSRSTGTAKLSAVFKLSGTDVVLNSVDEAYVEGANLIIPIGLQTHHDGYYRVRANLFDLGSGQPVSHLNSTFTLKQGSHSVSLKVHAATLRQQNASGPYLLTDFDLTRGPAKPGDKTGYGKAAKQYYEVSGYPLDSYSNEEYSDPKNQQRLEFLQKMAGLD